MGMTISMRMGRITALFPKIKEITRRITHPAADAAQPIQSPAISRGSCAITSLAIKPHSPFFRHI